MLICSRAWGAGKQGKGDHLIVLPPRRMPAQQKDQGVGSTPPPPPRPRLLSEGRQCRYHQAGTPKLEVSTSYDSSAHTYTITTRQSTPTPAGHAAKQPVMLPLAVALFDKDGHEMSLKLKVSMADIARVFGGVWWAMHTLLQEHSHVIPVCSIPTIHLVCSFCLVHLLFRHSASQFAAVTTTMRVMVPKLCGQLLVSMHSVAKPESTANLQTHMSAHSLALNTSMYWAQSIGGQCKSGNGSTCSWQASQNLVMLP